MDEQTRRHIEALEAELQRTQQTLQATIEELKEHRDQLALALDVAEMVSWEWHPLQNNIQSGRLSGNERLRAFFGVRDDRAGADLYWSRIHPGDVRALADNLEQARHRGGKFSLHFRLLHPTRGLRYVRSRGVFIGTGEERYSLGVSWDVTEQHLAERALAQQSAELQRINEELEQFASVAAHDLRQPLRTVVSFLDILEEDFGSTLPEEGCEFLRLARDGGRHMGLLLEGLLELSGVRRFGEPFVATDLAQVVEGVLGAMAPALHDSGAQITVDALPTVRVDGAQMTVVFRNIIENALKYRHLDRQPRIHIEARQINEFWEFAVVDNGIGIDPRFAEKIFVVFQRLHAQDEYPGAGIGLALCQRIIERHGGRIWVGPAAEVGSRFAFILPMSPAAE